MASRTVKPNIGIQQMLAVIAKKPGGHAAMGPEMASVAIAICERLEKIDSTLEAVRQAVMLGNKKGAR